jgi:hypothetical protein
MVLFHFLCISIYVMPTVLAKAVELLGVTVQPANGLGSNGFKGLGFALAHLSWVLLG